MGEAQGEWGGGMGGGGVRGGDGWVVFVSPHQRCGAALRFRRVAFLLAWKEEKWGAVRRSGFLPSLFCFVYNNKRRNNDLDLLSILFLLLCLHGVPVHSLYLQLGLGHGHQLAVLFLFHPHAHARRSLPSKAARGGQAKHVLPQRRRRANFFRVVHARLDFAGQ